MVKNIYNPSGPHKASISLLIFLSYSILAYSICLLLSGGDASKRARHKIRGNFPACDGEVS